MRHWTSRFHAMDGAQCDGLKSVWFLDVSRPRPARFVDSSLLP
jgi:hypothetical protein